MIQGVISRMSGFSANAKNFAVTVLVALVAVAFEKGVSLLWTGVGALAAFALMDIYYHLLEVRFRELYRTTALQPLGQPSDMLLDAPSATAAQVKKVLTSPTLLLFYVLLLFAFRIALYEAAHVSATKPESVGVAAGNSRGSPSGKVAAPEQPAGELPKHPADATKH